MTQEVKIIVSICLATIMILIGAVFFLSNGDQQNASTLVVDEAILTRNTHNKISSDSAKVTIVEFADFQCPACARVRPVLKQILDEYKGKVTFIYRHFPLPQHQNAILAAKASEAAGEQGKFWEMYDLLYERQSEWSESSKPLTLFTKYAKELKLDADQFLQDIKSSKYDESIKQDKNDGFSLGVISTPTLFINNKKVEGASTYENLKDIIEAEMKK